MSEWKRESEEVRACGDEGSSLIDGYGDGKG